MITHTEHVYLGGAGESSAAELVGAIQQDSGAAEPQSRMNITPDVQISQGINQSKPKNVSGQQSAEEGDDYSEDEDMAENDETPNAAKNASSNRPLATRQGGARNQVDDEPTLEQRKE